MLDAILEVGEELKGPTTRMKRPFPIYFTIAAFLRVIKSLGSGSLIKGFSRMQV